MKTMKNSEAPKILFVGDVNVDLMLGGLQHPVQEDREVMADSFFRTMGSSAAITAVAYRCLGGQADLCGLVGNDDNGSYMLSSLDELRIGRSLVTVDDETPTGVTVNLIYGRTRSQVTYPGTITKFEGPELTNRLAEYTHVHFSGIYQQTAFLPNLVPTLKYLENLGVSSSLDTQWDITERWDYLAEMYSYVDYLFVNKDEALSISGASKVEAAVEFFADRVRCTLVKIGHQGALLWTNGVTDEIPPYPAKVIDTTGAGDAFAGGFLHAIFESKLEVVTSAHYASAVAARNCEFAGGVGAKSSDSDIQKKLMEEKHA